MRLSLLAIWADGPIDPKLPKNTARQLDVPQGSDATIEVTLVDSLGNPVVLDIVECDSLILYARRAFGSDWLFKLSATAPATWAPGKYLMTMVPANTQDWQVLLIFDVWATISAKTSQVVALSYLNVVPAGVR